MSRWLSARMCAMDRLYRVQQSGEPFFAVDRDGELRRVTPGASGIFAGYTPEASIAGGLQAVRILAPARPSNITCVGSTYKDHVAEVHKPLPAEPLLFLKPSTAVIDPG